MAMSVTYTNFNGRTVHEDRGGTERGYVPDPLGSTKALVDSAGAIQDTWAYWPYGEVEGHTGPSTTPFTFVGTLGYHRDSVSKLTYVRARYYQGAIGQWVTMDPISQTRLSYVYAVSSPATTMDPSGYWPHYVGCPASVEKAIDDLCMLMYVMSDIKQSMVSQCIEAASRKAGISCRGITDNRLACIKRWCDTDGVLRCRTHIVVSGAALVGYTPGTPYFDCDRDDPSDEIIIDPTGVPATYAWWIAVGVPVEGTFIHELMHACGQHHNNTILTKSCNNIQACCLLEIVVGKAGGGDCIAKI